MLPDFANVNAQWSYALARTLKERGVAYAVVCPGSRSSPLAFAFAQLGGIEAIPALDERSAAFFALGLARRSGKPTALICTSGTAAANFLPAVIEASESGVPLIVLTADRPAELRQCAAGQTIDQVKLYGSYVRYCQEVALPENDLMLLRSLRQLASHSYDEALLPRPGPVHLNLPFRDPLPPLAEEGFQSVLQPEGEAFFEALDERAGLNEASSVELPKAFQTGKGLILVGPCNIAAEEIDAWLRNVNAFCGQIGWPVLADALNPLRFSAQKSEGLISHYDLILRGEGRPDRPDAVIVIGELPTSKQLRQWIQESEPPMLVLGAAGRNADPTFAKAQSLSWNFARSSPSLSPIGKSDYCDSWLSRDAEKKRVLAEAMGDVATLSEPKLAWLLGQSLPVGSALCVSNSMPPRDLEFFASANERDYTVYSSRGANGIDGILSNALGIAHNEKETYLVTGDLALLHDSNGGLIAKEMRGDLTIVLVNNNGGGIFEMLPVAEFEPVFERYFGTPQDVDFEKWAALYGIGYTCPSDWNELQDALAAETRGVRLIEVTIDRKQNAAWRKGLMRRLS